jgi:hypothetical protein
LDKLIDSLMQDLREEREQTEADVVEMEDSDQGAHTCFAIGSTKDEVLTVQGSPDRASDTYWRYGMSAVYFGPDGRVSGYSNYENLSWNVQPKTFP